MNTQNNTAKLSTIKQLEQITTAQYLQGGYTNLKLSIIGLTILSRNTSLLLNISGRTGEARVMTSGRYINKYDIRKYLTDYLVKPDQIEIYGDPEVVALTTFLVSKKYLTFDMKQLAQVNGLDVYPYVYGADKMPGCFFDLIRLIKMHPDHIICVAAYNHLVKVRLSKKTP